MRTYRALLIGNGEKISPRLLKQLAAQATAGRITPWRAV